MHWVTWLPKQKGEMEPSLLIPPTSRVERAAPAGWSPEDLTWGHCQMPIQAHGQSRYWHHPTRVHSQRSPPGLWWTPSPQNSWSCLPAGLLGVPRGLGDLYLCTQYNWSLWVEQFPTRSLIGLALFIQDLSSRLGCFATTCPSRRLPSAKVSGSKRGIGFSHHNPGGLHKHA